MNVDLNGLNGSNDLTARPVARYSSPLERTRFFPILVFNDQLRGPEPGSIALAPQGRSVSTASRCIGCVSKAARRRKTSFRRSLRPRRKGWQDGTEFFNIEGNQYDYDPNAAIAKHHGGRLLISDELANALGRPSDAGANVGKISIGATMQPVEIQQWSTAKPNQRSSRRCASRGPERVPVPT